MLYAADNGRSTLRLVVCVGAGVRAMCVFVCDCLHYKQFSIFRAIFAALLLEVVAWRFVTR